MLLRRGETGSSGLDPQKWPSHSHGNKWKFRLGCGFVSGGRQGADKSRSAGQNHHRPRLSIWDVKECGDRQLKESWSDYWSGCTRVREFSMSCRTANRWVTAHTLIGLMAFAASGIIFVRVMGPAASQLLYKLPAVLPIYSNITRTTSVDSLVASPRSDSPKFYIASPAGRDFSAKSWSQDSQGSFDTSIST